MPVLKKVLRNVLREPLSKATPAPVYAPDLDLKFAEELRLDPRVDFSRGSNATVVDSDGTLKWAGHNIAYKSGNTRLIVDTNTSLTAAPDGTNTADLIFPNSTSNTHEWAHTNNSVSGETYRAVVYGKHHSGDYRLGIRGFGNGATGAFPIFDLADGEVDQTGSAFSNATITDIGNGWYKCEATTTATGIFGLSISVVDSTGAHSFSGDEATGFFVWGGHVYRADKPMQQRTDVATGLETYYPTTSAAYYAPRFDHDPATNESLGLLIEEARTNLILASEDFSAGSWPSYDLTITTDQVASPDGTTNADQLTEGTGSIQPRLTDTILGGIGTNKTYVTSCFFKNNDARYGFVTLRSINGSVAYAVFDLEDGVVHSTGDHGNSSFTSASMEDYGNGWYRCVLISVSDTTDVSSSFVMVGITDSSTDPTSSGYVTITGDGSSLYVWGAQLEDASFPTSYIPTSGSSVTRSADVCDIDTTAFSFNFTEFSWFAEAQTKEIGGSFVHILRGGAATNERFLIQFDSDSAVRALVRHDGVNKFDQDIGSVLTTTQFVKVALGVKKNDTFFIVDGGDSVSDSTVDMPDTIADVGIGQNTAVGSPGYINGHIKQITYYARRLDDATLQALTQPSLEPSLNLVFDSSETSYVNTGLTR